MEKETWIHSETVFNMIAETRKQYTENVFPPPKKGSPPDAFSAAGARLACDLICKLVEEYVENVSDEKDI